MMSPHARCCFFRSGFQIGPVCFAWPSTSPFLFGVSTTYGLVLELVPWQIVCLPLLLPFEAPCMAYALGTLSAATAKAAPSANVRAGRRDGVVSMCLAVMV